MSESSELSLEIRELVDGKWQSRPASSAEISQYIKEKQRLRRRRLYGRATFHEIEHDEDEGGT